MMNEEELDMQQEDMRRQLEVDHRRWLEQEQVAQAAEQHQRRQQEQVEVAGGDGEGGLDLCLRQWREHHCLPPHPSLSSCPGFTSTEFLLQVIDYELDKDGKYTGRVTLTDSEFTVRAMLGTLGTSRQKFIELLKHKKLGKYSLVRVRMTVGPPEDLIIVSPNSFISLNLNFLGFTSF